MHRRRALDGQQDLRAVVVRWGIDLVAEVIAVERQQRGRELVGRGFIDQLQPVAPGRCPQPLLGGRGEVQHPQQLGHVDVLGSEAPA